MARNAWLASSLMFLALAPAAAGTPADDRAGHFQPVASRVSADYERGFGDGLNAKDRRERDGDYRAGYRAGRAQREANESRPDGRDYARGYVDGYNRYRERIAASSANRAYAAGYRAGQADHTAMVTDNTPQRPTPALGNPMPRPTNARATVGRPAAFLNDDMAALGYRSLGELKQRGQVVTLWRGTSDSDCFRISLADGRVKDVFQMSETECR